MYISEDWEEGAAYDCFGVGYREFDPIECNEESGNLEIPYSGDSVHWQTKFKDHPVENEPECSYRLEISCISGCVSKEHSNYGIPMMSDDMILNIRNVSEKLLWWNSTQNRLVI